MIPTNKTPCDCGPLRAELKEAHGKTYRLQRELELANEECEKMRQQGDEKKMTTPQNYIKIEEYMHAREVIWDLRQLLLDIRPNAGNEEPDWSEWWEEKVNPVLTRADRHL